MRVIGIDLAWGEGSSQKLANESGLVAVDQSGVVVDAAWTCGIHETARRVEQIATPDTLLMVDAPLVVANTSGQRLCEKQVGQQYGRWKVSANSTNLSSPRRAGVVLLRMLEASGWRYHDGCDGVPPKSGHHVAEVYPYTAIVGAPELGYDLERPIYKRRPRSVPTNTFRALRAANCDDLVRRLATLHMADPPIDLTSHPITRTLVAEASPLNDHQYKHREDLIDAVLSAWTGLLWLSHGLKRCQVLGIGDPCARVATIIAPARSEQRRPGTVSKARIHEPASVTPKDHVITPPGPVVRSPCLCGCGQLPKGKRSRFVPGHDNRINPTTGYRYNAHP